MNISYKEFESYCPAAMTPDRSVFDAVRPFIDSNLEHISKMLPDDLYRRLDDTPHDPDEAERFDRLRRAVAGWACTLAFYNAIPQLDLVLTSTGFGVVSNQNVAPASESRVRQLRNELDRLVCDNFDSIIDLSRPLVRWIPTRQGRDLFRSLFWRGEHMLLFGIPRPTRRDLFEHMPDIEACAEHLKLIISPELYRRLLEAEASDSGDEYQAKLIALCRNATAAWAKHDGSWTDFRHSILGYIEGHLDRFPEYRDSQTYKANHFSRYENRKNDSCFFFG